jgi:general stress protein CsbA
MASVLNRTTKVYLASANTPDYPVAEWIIEPDMSAVVGYPSKYWVITGDIVSLMPVEEREAVDFNEMQIARDSTANRMDNIEDIIRALALATLDEINNLRSLHSLAPRTGAQLKTAVRNKLGT